MGLLAAFLPLPELRKPDDLVGIARFVRVCEVLTPDVDEAERRQWDLTTRFLEPTFARVRAPVGIPS